MIQAFTYDTYLPFEKVMSENPKWLNVSTKDQDIVFDLNGMVLKIKNDINAIKALNSEVEQECLDAYLESGNNLSVAIQRNTQYLSDKNKVVEKVKEAEIKKPIEKLDDLASAIRMHHFIVSEADAEQVRQFLKFSNITFREE